MTMSETARTTKKKIVPKPKKARSFKAAMDATNKKYAWTFEKLAK